MPSKLSVKKAGNWPFYEYTLIEDFSYAVTIDSGTYIRTLHKGWKFDGATFGWLIGLRQEASMDPAAIHDDMYENKGMLFVNVKGTAKYTTIHINKKFADKLYLKNIDDTEEGGVNTKSWQRALVRAAFLTIGQLFWRT